MSHVTRHTTLVTHPAAHLQPTSSTAPSPSLHSPQATPTVTHTMTTCRTPTCTACHAWFCSRCNSPTSPPLSHPRTRSQPSAAAWHSCSPPPPPPPLQRLHVTQIGPVVGGPTVTRRNDCRWPADRQHAVRAARLGEEYAAALG